MSALTFTLMPLSRSAEAATPRPTGPGALIIDLGIAPQTINHGLKPYGLGYETTSSRHGPLATIHRNTNDSVGTTSNSPAINGAVS